MRSAGALLALTVLHDLDHLRQGRELPLVLNVIGALATLGAVGIFLWSGRRGDENVARVAETFGFTTALGLVIVHVLPNWPVISDPYGEAGVDAMSWLSLVAFIAGGITLGVVAHRHEALSRETSAEAELLGVDPPAGNPEALKAGSQRIHHRKRPAKIDGVLTEASVEACSDLLRVELTLLRRNVETGSERVARGRVDLTPEARLGPSPHRVEEVDVEPRRLRVMRLCAGGRALFLGSVAGHRR